MQTLVEKNRFEIKNETEDQGQSSPKSIGTLKVPRCISGPILENLTSIGGDFSSGQAQNGVNFNFEAEFNLEAHGQSPHKTIGILTKVFYISGPNLVILAEMVDELSSGQVHDWQTDTRTHTHTQATTIPEGQNWPRVKMEGLVMVQ